MKHRLLTTLAAVLIALSAWATEIDGINYRLDSNKKTAEVISRSPKYQGAITIPASVTTSGTTYSVTSIGDDAFFDCTSLTSINIPNSVTSIGSYAFSDCTSLTSITIPNSVTSIGNYAFCDCTGLTSITIGNSVTSIGWYAFYHCTGLTSITIPSSVTSIGSCAFYDCTSLTSITIPTSVTEIGSWAFKDCTGLTSITIPNSVTSIGSYAFIDCTGLTSITIPNSVTTIGDYAFARCIGLTSITIPNSVTSIGADAFKGCTGLEDIYALRTDPAAYDCATDAFSDYSVTLHVPADSKEAYTSTAPWSRFANIVDDIDNSSDDAVALTADGEDVWTDGVLRFSVSSEENGEAVVSGVKDKDNLGAVTIPEKVKIADKVYSVTSIGGAAFYNCTGLTSINIPASVTSIGDDAFVNCTSLKKVCITDIAAWCGIKFANLGLFSNPLYYARHLYLNNEEVTELTIPSSVTSIGDQAFYGCTGLTSITIPNSVTSIGYYAFSGCKGLTSISIPESVTSIGGSAFEGCEGLTSITIPNSVTSIEEYAFSGCTSLTSITIPNSVTWIGNYAFYRCTDLTSITIPNSVTSIEEGAFFRCSGLTSIEIPNSVTRIGDYAFANCSGLTSIIIPESVTSIGAAAFEGCEGLTDIYALRTDPAAYDCATDAFSDYSATLHVPAGSKEAYASTEPWSNFANIVDDIDTGSDDAVVLTADGEDVWTDGVLRFSVSSEENGEAVVSGVKDKDNLGAVTIPEKVKIADKVYTVTSIGFRAFYECSGLTSATIPNSVTSIGSCAFLGCTSLTSITIPNSVTSIDNSAFAGCSGLTSITIPSSVTSIRSGAFTWCSGLTSIKVEAGNTKYDSRDNCNAIIETASNTLVAGCKATSISNSVTSIGSHAFWGCTGLTSITIPNSVTSIGERAFLVCTGLTDIYALRTDPAAYNCATVAFSDYSATLHVPAGSKEAYASTEPWSNFANIVEEEDLTAIQSLTLTPSEAGESYYNLQGQCIAEPQRGQIVVVRRADGTSRKMYVR